jgi:hypothetical protein
LSAAFIACAAMRPVHADDAKLQGEIATADTAVVVEAGEHAPRLLTLSFPGAAPWKNTGDEPLPERIEIHGAPQPTIWRLDRIATRFESKQIQIVYLADSPRLKAVWRWQARAEHGPIEHSLSIQNLGDEPVWLPLQASLRFDWEIDPGAALQRFWVEKGADIPSPQGTHLDALTEGATWQGSSSTYAIPQPGRPREMIPYLLVDELSKDRRGWYIGIEFSGRTASRSSAASHRCAVRRGSIQAQVPIALVCRRAAASKPRRFLSAHFAAGRTMPAISCAAGYERSSMTPARWPIRPIPCWSTIAGAAAWQWTKRLHIE